MQITRTSGLGRTHSTTHAPKSAVAASAVAAAKVPPAVVDEIVSKLKAACKSQSVAPKEVLECLVQLEKAKLQPSPSWQQAMTSGRWRLIYSAKSKDVTAAMKGKEGGPGRYFKTFAVAQKFDAADSSFQNGVFFGNVGYLTFKAPYRLLGRRMTFDICTVYLRLGPFQAGIPVKSGDKCKAINDMEPKEVNKMPRFFFYAYVDEDIIVGRGPSGGLALWGRGDADWLASSGVLQVYK